MPTHIKISIDGITIDAEFFDTVCAGKIIDALPIEGTLNEWGDEFYFTIPVEFSLDETATVDVNVGDIGYWPPGSALAIFFGPTPLSTGSKPVPAGKVNIVGKIIDDPEILIQAKGAERIMLTKKKG
ncbi:MAG TPA: cyclophilin-like fold protein [Syntrophorhabdaceae bacterium]|nr:cyclophilin-like fold protein [Syntrophorhabdaceae bacterium]HPU30010.1 cyclophilin-like fold protein [Syntrophorhabdaceae bacterium]